MQKTAQQKRFARYAWFVLAFTIVVILWGAYVRATGSGAGCGQHWPSCNGTVVPRPERIETIIEFTHRLSSALLGILIAGLLVWSLRAYAPKHLVRRGAIFSLIFVLIEGALGAGLVLFELVAHNDSLARAVSSALHLVNTFILIAWITLTAWWASGGKAVRLKNQGTVGRLLGIALMAMLVLASTGAVTALGDTLFPASSLAAGLQEDFSETAHFLVRLRVWHPTIAVIVSIYLILAGNTIGQMRPAANVKRLAWLLNGLFGLQLAVGSVNVWLLAPVWMQMVHLLLADMVWIVFILLGASVLAEETAVAPQPAIVASQLGD